MLDLNNRYILLLLFLFALIGCNNSDNDSSTINTAPTKKTTFNQNNDPIVPEMAMTHSTETIQNTQHNAPKEDNSTGIDIDKLPKSKVLITANQTNAWRATFDQFDLELANIRFTLKPESIDQEIDVYMNKVTQLDQIPIKAFPSI